MLMLSPIICFAPYPIARVRHNVIMLMNSESVTKKCLYVIQLTPTPIRL